VSPARLAYAPLLLTPPHTSSAALALPRAPQRCSIARWWKTRTMPTRSSGQACAVAVRPASASPFTGVAGDTVQQQQYGYAAQRLPLPLRTIWLNSSPCRGRRVLPGITRGIARAAVCAPASRVPWPRKCGTRVCARCCSGARRLLPAVVAGAVIEGCSRLAHSR